MAQFVLCVVCSVAHDLIHAEHVRRICTEKKTKQSPSTGTLSCVSRLSCSKGHSNPYTLGVQKKTE